MPYSVVSRCDHCAEGDEFVIGNWRKHLGVYICRDVCKSVVSVPLQTAACPGCGRGVAAWECLDYSHCIPYLDGEFVVEPQPGPACPKCGQGRLSFHPTIRHSMATVLGSPLPNGGKGKQHLEKEIFGHALMVACTQLRIEPREGFAYFGLDINQAILSRMGQFCATGKGLSTPILYDIRTHLFVRRGLFTPLPGGSR